MVAAEGASASGGASVVRPLPPVMVYAFDADGTCTLSEGPGLARIGLSREELVGRSVHEVFAHLPAVLANIDEVLAGRRVRNVTVVDHVELDTFIEPLFDAAGQVVGAFGTSVDVTEERARERQLADVARRDGALASLSASLAADSDDVDAVLEHAARVVAELLGGFVIVWTLTERVDELVPAARWHDDPDKRARVDGYISRVDPSLPMTLAASALDRGRPDALGADELAAALTGDAERVRAEANVEDVAHAPMMARGQILGVLAVYREPDHGSFDADDLTLLGEVAGRIGMALANARLLAEQRLAEERARQLSEQRQALLAREAAAVEAERARIAADVHDDSLQVLAAVDLRLGVLRRRLRDEGPENLDLIDRLHADIQEAVDRLRELLFDLEAPARELGLGDALRRAAAHAFADSGVDWRLEDGAGRELPQSVRTVAYRICQEALANVRRHSGARRVRVVLGVADGGLLLEVADDGRGMDASASGPRLGHLGLAGMRERADAAGGWWRLESRSGAGTTGRAWLPLDGAQQRAGTDA